MAKINILEEKFKNQNLLIENIKKSRNNIVSDISEKTFNLEELKVELLSKNKRIKELEQDNSLLKSKTE